MILEDLYNVITERIKSGDPEKSYVAKLHTLGEERVLKKISEESFELIIACKNKNRDSVIYETADLFFHILILLAERDIKIDEVFKELERRFGISGLEEKKQRKGENE
ncbi:MAG: phosphoribosyl-ATP diphosphatase [Proteobacteria bacterium]|nr:phosphoribosyl-ATP diphosphatase [Pseudomonadota bacterium]